MKTLHLVLDPENLPNPRDPRSESSGNDRISNSQKRKLFAEELAAREFWRKAVEIEASHTTGVGKLLHAGATAFAKLKVDKPNYQSAHNRQSHSQSNSLDRRKEKVGRLLNKSPFEVME